MQHIAKQHSGMEEHNRKEDHKVNCSEIQDLDEGKLIKGIESMKTVDIEEKDKSFVFSGSKFFDEFL